MAKLIIDTDPGVGACKFSLILFQQEVSTEALPHHHEYLLTSEALQMTPWPSLPPSTAMKLK